MKINLQGLADKKVESAKAQEIAYRRNEPLCHKENIRIKVEELLQEYAQSKFGVSSPILEYVVDVGTYVSTMDSSTPYTVSFI